MTVGTWRNQVLNGYYNYHAVPGNLRSLWVFRNQVAQPWWRVLRRRSQKARQRWVDFAPLIPRSCPCPRSGILTLWSGFTPNIRDRSRVR